MIACFQGEARRACLRIPGRRLGDRPCSFLRRARTDTARPCSESRPCARRCAGAHADMSRRAGSQRCLGRAQFADALFERGGRMIAADGGRAFEDLGAVLALHPDRRVRGLVLRLRDDGANTFAFEAGIAVVRGEQPCFEPARTPERDAQRGELAEMRRSFDRAAFEAELLRGRVIVDRGVTSYFCVASICRGERSGPISSCRRCPRAAYRTAVASRLASSALDLAEVGRATFGERAEGFGGFGSACRRAPKISPSRAMTA